MRTKHKTLIIAISTALLTTTSLYAQVKDESAQGPLGPSTSEPLGAVGLPGQLCSESPGASGATCAPAIPDNATETDSRFEVTGCSGTILDVDIGLDVSHTWVGDLIFTVQSPSATSVTIVDRPGFPPGLGCFNDNIFAVLDDSAATPVENECANGFPTISGIFTPNNPLSAFNGESANGIWLLTVSDHFPGDTGQVNDWSVDVNCSDPEGDPRATFEVNKVFTDGNPGEVDVTLDCFTGLPITQTQTISEGQNVVFIVTDFDDGELDCAVTEEDVTGYSAEYNNNATTTSESCEYEDVVYGQEAECTIINTPDQVDVNVDKVWVLEGSSGDELDARFDLTLICNGQIATFEPDNDGLWRWTVNGNDTLGLGMRARVTPDWDGGTDCWVEETVYDSSVETDNGCQYGALHIEIGQGASCFVTNTVFYEGIPTLSNYGLALLTLMTLGVGFVGFRRFA